MADDIPANKYDPMEADSQTDLYEFEEIDNGISNEEEDEESNEEQGDEEREWPEIVNEAYDIFSEYTEELGFVSKVQVEDALEDDMLYYNREDNGDMAAVALIRHCKNKPQTTIQDIATDPEYTGNGHAKDILDRVRGDSPNPYMVAKCPKDLPANHFYREDGWQLYDVEDGKNRELLVWRKEVTGKSALDW